MNEAWKVAWDPDEVTTNWRAVHERTACMVRGGGMSTFLPDLAFLYDYRRLNSRTLKILGCRVFKTIYNDDYCLSRLFMALNH